MKNSDEKQLVKQRRAEKRAAKKQLKEQGAKKPITHEKIFKIMLWITFIVAGAFLLINVIKLNVPGMIAIGGSLVAFIITLFIMKWRHTRMVTKELVLGISLELIIFAISLFSGESYSDDFPMFLAVIGMTGMYMEPNFTKVQIVIADVLLVAMYIINPGKAESLSQYILCLVIFTLAAFLVLLTIKRGRSFIDMNREQALRSEELLWSMREMGEKLEIDFNKSSQRIDDNTRNLEKGSVTIIRGAGEVSDSCGSVQDKIHKTSHNITELNDQVRKFETALSENGSNMHAMTVQLDTVNDIINKTSKAVTDMKTQMNEVAAIAEQLGNISFKTTLLSLNASVEASHAGSAGAGFAVVASEMKELSDNSDRFSERVSEVVSHLLMQVETISEQFESSTRALQRSENTMSELQDSFDHLTDRFESLYKNIEEQTENVADVDTIFRELKQKVAEMKHDSAENKSAVEKIVVAMDDYRESIGKVIENTKVS